MRLLAISDLHVGYQANREAVEALPAHPEDWLILGGDLGETEDQLAWVLDTLGPRFAQLVWVPGNHELWTMRRSPARGVARYDGFVERCRSRGVLTPEDPFPTWPGDGPPTVIAPCFALYDYSFCDAPDPIAWAAEAHIVAVDEARLHADPYPSVSAWCAARVRLTEERLAAVPAGHEIVLVNHWPLRADLVRLPDRVARFLPWCGTRKTEQWHTRFPVSVVVTGHLHMRATDWRDGVRFEEVATGYPRHWRVEGGLDPYLRTILPHPSPRPAHDHAGPVWHR